MLKFQQINEEEVQTDNSRKGKNKGSINICLKTIVSNSLVIKVMQIKTSDRV